MFLVSKRSHPEQHSTYKFAPQIIFPFSFILQYRKLQEELILQEQMFQEMKEAKDVEILSIKQMKHELEVKLDSLLNKEENGE